MQSGHTKLDVHWDTTLSQWVFRVRRETLDIAWTITPEQFKEMLNKMQDMDDEFNCAIGAKLRNQVNKGEAE